MPERSRDRIRRGQSDLRHAREDRDYDWSAFASHQAADEAIKELFQRLNLEACGHVVSVLMANLPQKVRPDESLIDRAKELDQH